MQKYQYAFRIQNNLERSAASSVARNGAISASLLLSNLQLTQGQFAAFREAAHRFAPTDKEVTGQIRALAAADRAKHPNARRLTKDTQFQIDTLLAEKLTAATEQTTALQRTLSAQDAAQLDEKIALLYSEQLRKLSLDSGSPGRVASSLGDTSDIRAAIQSVSGVASPLSTDPGGSNCIYVPADEEQDDIDACDDEGGDYNLETCECTPDDGGGGGGGGADPEVTVTVLSPPEISYGQQVDNPQISATVSVTTGPAPTGTVNFAMTPAAVPAAEDVPLTSNTATSSIANWNLATLDGNPIISVGNYSTAAVYSGDENYDGKSGSGTLAIVRAQTVSQIANCPSGTVTAGQTQSFSISVTWEVEPTTSTVLLATPTGQVILSDTPYGGKGGTQSTGSLATFPASPSTATLAIAPAVIGTNYIKVSYQGDSNYTTSSSAECTIVVVAPPG